MDWTRIARSRRAIDLASITNGGLVIGASDMHFGAKDNMIMPGRATNMGDGWETRRRRGPGYDWAIVRLGAWPRCRRSRSTPITSRATTRTARRSRAVPVPSSSMSDARIGRMDRDPAANRPQAPPPAFLLAGAGQGRSRSRTSGSTSFPMAASAGCASMETWQAIDRAAPQEARRLLARACGSSRWVERMIARARSAAARRFCPPLAPSGTRSTTTTGARRSPTTRRSATATRCASGFPPRTRSPRASRRASMAPPRPCSTRSPRAIAATKRTFGYIFIVCASGLSADEMLARLHDRLENDPGARDPDRRRRTGQDYGAAAWVASPPSVAAVSGTPACGTRRSCVE